jgi:tetratricopeptide (TPR) repeat protein
MLEDENLVEQLRALAKGEPDVWRRELLETWPSPIADAYASLRRYLQAGNVGSSLWALKDLAEILIRLPTLVMAAEILEEGEQAHRERVLGQLLAGPLSMGTWLRILRQVILPPILADKRHADVHRIASTFATIDTKGKAVPSKWTLLLERVVSWRNEIHHGAFRTDASEYVPELVRQITEIEAHLEGQVTDGLWLCTLATNDAGLAPGRGATPPGGIGAPTGTVKDGAVKMFLFRQGRKPLALGPLVTVRCCPQCRSYHVFCFGGGGGAQATRGISFHEYWRGHHVRVPPALLMELAPVKQLIAAQEGLSHDLGLDDVLLEAKAAATLDAAAMKSKYVPPRGLRRRLKAYLDTHRQGIVWLQAPAHCGKSVFVRALDDPEAVDERVIAPDLVVAAFHIRREYRTSLAQFEEFLEVDLLRERLGIVAGKTRLRLSELEGRPPDEAVREFLETAIRACGHSQRLLLCIDGLDELPIGSPIPDFLPEASRLPPGVVLLLTSRPAADLTTALRTAIHSRLDETCETIVIDPQASAEDVASEDYRETLRTFYGREMELALQRDMRRALEQFVGGTGEDICCRDDLSHTLPADRRQIARCIFTELSSGRRVRALRDAPSLSAAVLPVLAHYDEAFDAILAASLGRFQSFAVLTTMTRDYSAESADLGRLPEGRDLYKWLLGLYEKASGGGPAFAIVRDVLVILAVERSLAIALARTGCEWHRLTGGLSLEEISVKVGLSGRSQRLMQILFEMKDLLNVVRRKDETVSRYELADEDVAAGVEEAFAERVRAAFDALAEDLTNASDTETGLAGFDDEALIRGSLSALLNDELDTSLLSRPAIREVFSGRANEAYSQNRFADSVALTTVFLGLAEKELERGPSLEALWTIPYCLRTRAQAYHAARRPAAALESAQRGWDALRRLKEEVPERDQPSVDYQAALLHNAIGNILIDGGRTEEAIRELDAGERRVKDAGSRLSSTHPAARVEVLEGHAAILQNRARAYGLAGDEEAANRDVEALIGLLSNASEKDLLAAQKLTSFLAAAYQLRSMHFTNVARREEALRDAQAAVDLVGFEMRAHQPGQRSELLEDGCLVVNAYRQLGCALFGLSRFSEALEVVEAGLEWARVYIGGLHEADARELKGRQAMLEGQRAELLMCLPTPRIQEALAAAGRAVEIELALFEESDKMELAFRRMWLANALELRIAIAQDAGQMALVQADGRRLAQLEAARPTGE